MEVSLQSIQKTGVYLIWFLSLGVALVSYRFLALGLGAAFPVMANHIASLSLAFLLHVSASPIALALGLFQFLPKLRAKRPALHRWSGRAYGLAILIGGLSGLVISYGSLDRPIAGIGFGLLAVVWLAVTGNAIRLAMAGRIVEHRRWMIRSFALTLAAVTLRLLLPIFMGAGAMEYAEASNYVAWLCWVPNLIITEFNLRSGRGSSRAFPG